MAGSYGRNVRWPHHARYMVAEEHIRTIPVDGSLGQYQKLGNQLYTHVVDSGCPNCDGVLGDRIRDQLG